MKDVVGDVAHRLSPAMRAERHSPRLGLSPGLRLPRRKGLEQAGDDGIEKLPVAGVCGMIEIEGHPLDEKAVSPIQSPQQVDARHIPGADLQVHPGYELVMGWLVEIVVGITGPDDGDDVSRPAPGDDRAQIFLESGIDPGRIFPVDSADSLVFQ